MIQPWFVVGEHTDYGIQSSTCLLMKSMMVVAYSLGLATGTLITDQSTGLKQSCRDLSTSLDQFDLLILTFLFLLISTE